MSAICLKIFLLFSFLAINAGVATLTWYYDEYYWYLAIISLGTLYKAIFVGLITCHFCYRFLSYIFGAIKYKENNDPVNSIAFAVPCYTEDYDQVCVTMTSLMNSIKYARELMPFKPVFYVLVDGMNRGKGCSKTTYEYVLDVIGGGLSEDLNVKYTSWKECDNTCRVSYGKWNDVDIVVIGKQINQGKKDSLILVRDIVHNLNDYDHYTSAFRKFYSEDHHKFDYIVGVDTGSYFSENAIYNLLKKIHNDKDILGVSGFIKVHLNSQNYLNFWTFYQYFEYIFQQGLTRLGQSFLGAVTCLPGCLQIIRVSDETMGKPLESFRKLPKNNSHLEKVRAYLGEDRRFTCLMLYNNPHKKIVLSTDALVYTDVPYKFSVLLSQRRRWFLSSQANNIRDFLSNLPILIRFVAIIQVWTFVFTLVTLVCLARLIWIIVMNHNLIVLAAFSSMIFITIYKNILALCYSDSIGKFIYMFLSMITYTLICPFINTFFGIYAIWYMDDYNWGKTQQVVPSHHEIVSQNINVQNINVHIDTQTQTDVIENVDNNDERITNISKRGSEIQEICANIV